MSTIVVNGELHAAVKCGDVEAVDQALQSGVSPDSEVADRDSHGWTRHRSLLYLAAKVHSLEYICVALFFLP